MFRIQIIVFVLFLSTLFSCKETIKEKSNFNENILNSITYAKGFSLHEFSAYKKLTIHTSFKGDSDTQEYFLVPKSQNIPKSIKDKNIIRVPIERIVVTSTTHIPMLELLGVENTLVGFPNTDYISSEKTRALIENGEVQELGQEQHINTEILIELHPELVVGFGVNSINQSFQNIKKTGIPVVMNSDWLEQTPLGRAEWIRFFGALFQKDTIASTRFKQIAMDYISIKEKAYKTTEKPTVLSGSLFQDVWHMPAGNSFVAHFLRDAKTDYLWKDTKGTGSLSLSLESVLEKGKNATFWIAPGFFTSKEVMLQNSPHYKEFYAFSSDNIFTYATKKGATGGVLYYELATARPDLVLKDLVSIFHPEDFPNYEKTFFEKVK